MIKEVQNLGSLKKVFLHSKGETKWQDLLNGSTIEILHFEFENKNLFITACGEDDSIIITNDSPTELKKLEKKKDISSKIYWKNCLNKEILFFWLLKNSKDIEDGFQFQFGPLDNQSRTIQGMVMASKFHFYILEGFKN